MFSILAGACTAAAGQTATEPPLTTLPRLAVDTTSPAPPPSTAAPATTPSTTSAPTTTTTLPERFVPAGSVGEPWGSVDGLLMFRGNPTRTYYGTGPVPADPALLWRFPDSAMCSISRIGGQDVEWCGTGWTGQPVVWERPDGVTEVIFGAYDQRIHFVDAATGLRTRPDFPVGDIAKGSVTLDPDGYPLLFAGSRDPNYRIIALDRDVPTELWSLPATAVRGMWNNDWDSNAVIIDDFLLIGGENSWWFAVQLNRTIDGDGLVQIAPEIVASIPAFTDELVAAVGTQQSIESSTAVYGSTAYFANSAGRIVGIDISHLPEREADIVFDFWAGDDVDATIVIDEFGMLYVAAEEDLRTPRAAELGQLMKLDPQSPDDPLVWSLSIPGSDLVDGGVWATPALDGEMLYVPTNPGELLAVDTETGEVVWRDDVGAHAWSSPVIIDESLIVAVDCDIRPALRAYDISDPMQPQQQWEVAATAGCIESTPAVWNGVLYVGARDGFFYAIGDR